MVVRIACDRVGELQLVAEVSVLLGNSCHYAYFVQLFTASPSAGVGIPQLRCQPRCQRSDLSLDASSTMIPFLCCLRHPLAGTPLLLFNC